MVQSRQKTVSIDEREVERFDRLSEEWWSESGPMVALHKLNPTRVSYIREQLARRFGGDGRDRGAYAPRPLEGISVLDAGCGAGLLAEPLARLGARVTAIDPAARNIAVAREHAAAARLEIDYRCASVEALADEGARFDAVLAMEVLEHVRDVAGFVGACAAMTRPGGAMFAATLNRTFKSYALAIVGAEYVLGWAPRGTHDWRRFITPRELARALEAAGLRVLDEAGVVYDPLRGAWRLSSDMAVNYMIAAGKP